MSPNVAGLHTPNFDRRSLQTLRLYKLGGTFQLIRDWPLFPLSFRYFDDFSSPCFRFIPSQQKLPYRTLIYRATYCILQCHGEIQPAFTSCSRRFSIFDCDMPAPIHHVHVSPGSLATPHVTRFAGCGHNTSTKSALCLSTRLLTPRGSPHMTCSHCRPVHRSSHLTLCRRQPTIAFALPQLLDAVVPTFRTDYPANGHLLLSTRYSSHASFNGALSAFSLRVDRQL